MAASEGWYADPVGKGAMRYFDGALWTGHVLDSQGHPMTYDPIGTASVDSEGSRAITEQVGESLPVRKIIASIGKCPKCGVVNPHLKAQSSDGTPIKGKLTCSSCGFKDWVSAWTWELPDPSLIELERTNGSAGERQPQGVEWTSKEAHHGHWVIGVVALILFLLSLLTIPIRSQSQLDAGSVHENLALYHFLEILGRATVISFGYYIVLRFVRKNDA